MRLDRLLSKWNVASRTVAARLVREGRVRVDGRIERDPSRWLDMMHVRVELDGERLAPPAATSFVTYAYNKPRGEITTTHDPQGRKTVMAAFEGVSVPGLAPVGRLDRASAGLLIVTNDAAFANVLLDPTRHVPKLYRVKIKGHPRTEDLRVWREESLDDGGVRLGPMEVDVESEGPRSAWLRITLREGKNRQIRRRVEARGFEIEHLVRIAIGRFELGELAKGAFRQLGESDRDALLTEP